MNKEQQELYEKLLKKVNEYCLGATAEDVIAAIDDLVDTYENKITFIFGSRMNGKSNMLFNAYEEHKALEIIKEKVAPLVCLDTIDIGDGSNKLKYRVYDNELYAWRPLTKKQYELLKEVLGK